jgi:PhnB protein
MTLNPAAASSLPGSSPQRACSLAPWLTVPGGTKAADFYKSAFGATEVYRYDSPTGGSVVRLSVQGAEFWISEEAPADSAQPSQPVGGNSVRMILTVADPDPLFAQAIAAGATEIFPVAEGHGWRLGRLADPFGLHWEIGHPLAE